MKKSILLSSLFVVVAGVSATAQCPVNAGPDRILCLNSDSSIELLGSPAGGQWSGSGVTPQGTFSSQTPGYHTLQYSYTTPSGCVGTDEVVVSVNPAPAISAGSAQEVCLNGTSIDLSTNAEVVGTWSGVGTNISGVFSPSVAGVGEHTLTLTADVNGCIVSSQVNVTVKPIPGVIAGENLQVCSDASLVPIQATYPVGGQWIGPMSPVAQNMFDPSMGAGTYTFTYRWTSPVTGCTGFDTKTIEVFEAPAVAYEMESTTSCTYPVVVPVTVNNSENTTYTWKINGETTTALYFNSVGNYTIERIATRGACTASQVKSFEVKQAPTAEFSLSNTGGCPGTHVKFENNSTNASIYIWELSNGESFMSRTPSITFNESGVYDVKLTAISSNGCSNERMIPAAIRIHETPEFEIVSSKAAIITGEIVDFEVSGAQDVTWFLADGTIAQGQKVSTLFRNAGENNIEVNVLTAEGCQVEKSTKVLVEQAEGMKFPGQFTPNGDGQADQFRPMNIGDWTAFNLKIYDMNGRVVFAGNNASEGWDGANANGGIYIYQAQALDTTTGHTISANGKVLLMN